MSDESTLVDRLNHEAAISDRTGQCQRLEAIASEVAALIAGRDVLRQDAERYRWMRANDWDAQIVSLCYGGDYETAKWAELDEAVDAARSAA